MHDQDREVTGVDTHGEVHVAAVIDASGRILGTDSFPATLAGPSGAQGRGHRAAPDLRAARLDAGITLAVAAEALGTWPIRLSKLERGLAHDAELARRYQLWLQHPQAA